MPGGEAACPRSGPVEGGLGEPGGSPSSIRFEALPVTRLNRPVERKGVETRPYRGVLRAANFRFSSGGIGSTAA
jgi:hypothetical protein